MTENATPMHGEAIAPSPASTPPLCDSCGKPFAPRKRWQHFCSAKCRNAFHTEEKRKESVRRAAPELYDALLAARLILRGKDLEHAWVNYPTEPALTLGTKIDKALAKAGYKPEKPKA
jgi:predicted nucleic acid-binding Zn ribbon protein